MSALAATVTLGETGRADGSVKVARVVGHLYVGGSGAWHFHRLPDGDSAAHSLRSESRGLEHFWREVAGGFGHLMRDALDLGAGPAQPSWDELVALAGRVGAFDVAAAVALTDHDAADGLQDLSAVPGWSVTVAAPAFERRASRWGTTDTRPGAQGRGEVSGPA